MREYTITYKGREYKFPENRRKWTLEDKVLFVLSQLCEGEVGYTPSKIAKMSGLKTSTVIKVLNSLERWDNPQYALVVSLDAEFITRTLHSKELDKFMGREE